MSGYGILTHNAPNSILNKTNYAGQFKNDRKEGYAIFLAKDGKKYEGWFHNNRMHGLIIQKDPQKAKQK